MGGGVSYYLEGSAFLRKGNFDICIIWNMTATNYGICVLFRLIILKIFVLDHMVYSTFPIFCHGYSVGASINSSWCFYGTLVLRKGRLESTVDGPDMD